MSVREVLSRAAVASTVLVTTVVYSQGLQRVESGLTTIQTSVLNIVLIVATIAMAVIGTLIAMRGQRMAALGTFVVGMVVIALAKQFPQYIMSLVS